MSLRSTLLCAVVVALAACPRPTATGRPCSVDDDCPDQFCDHGRCTPTDPGHVDAGPGDDAGPESAEGEGDAGGEGEGGEGEGEGDAGGEGEGEGDAAGEGEGDAGGEGEGEGDLASPATSKVAVSAAKVAICNAVVVELEVRDANGVPLGVGGDAVAFNVTGGVSVNSFVTDAVVDHGDGTYSARMIVGQNPDDVVVGATLNGADVTSTAPLTLEGEPVLSGLLFHVDASRAGGGSCASASPSWVDTVAALPGTLSNVAGPPSGFKGLGLPDDPFRVVFDGAGDVVDFGAQVATAKFTLAAWVRPRGVGSPHSTGNAGIDIAAVVAKGAPEAELDAVDINYVMGVSSTRTVDTDFEKKPDSLNQPLGGAGVMTDAAWHFIAVTYDQVARTIVVDGVLDTSQPLTSVPSGASTSRLAIGSMLNTTGTPPSQNGHLSGDVAAAFIFSRALSVGELSSLCKATSTRFAGANCGP